MHSTPRFIDEIEGSEVPHVPAGRYLARLAGVELTTTRFGSAHKWYWTVNDPRDGSEHTVTQMTSTATSGGSSGGRNIRALLGRGLASGEKLSTQLLSAGVVTLDLSINEAGYNRVEAVEPAQRPTAPAKPGSAQAMIDRLEAAKPKVQQDGESAEIPW